MRRTVRGAVVVILTVTMALAMVGWDGSAGAADGSGSVAAPPLEVGEQRLGLGVGGDPVADPRIASSLSTLRRSRSRPASRRGSPT